MDTFEAIYQRRAVKGFDPEHRLTPDEEKKLLEGAIQAPTSFNIQHWRFVVLRDPELRLKIREELGNDQAQMTYASLLVLMTADVQAWRKQPERYWHNAPPEVAKMLVDWMGPFHEGRDWLQRDEAQRSIGMAMQTLMLAAKSMGYDSCPMIGFDIDKVAELVEPGNALGPGQIYNSNRYLMHAQLSAWGFEVVDLGINNAVESYMEALTNEEPDILGMSALLTTTMPYMKVVIDTLKEQDRRRDYIVLVGGAPINEELGEAVQTAAGRLLEEASR